MRELPCSWAVLRVVPHPHTGAGTPVGVVLQCRPALYVGLRALTDPDRLRRIAPDVDVALLARYLRSCEAIARGRKDAGPIALLSPPERFHWLSSPRSDVLQPGPTEYGSATDPAERLETLFRERVEDAGT
ncbi:MAG: DUF3037 domain-containing protein [Gemmatimonadota bacterium]|jgi:hypothetical protein